VHLTIHSDYALRVLIALGVAKDRRGTIGSIATSYGISRNHLMKVCHRLQRLGYIEGIRGKGGGLRLAREPDEIRIGDVLRTMEPGFELVECFGEENRCAITNFCRLRGILGDALAEFFRVLDRYTLADLLGPAPRLAALLDISAGIPRARRGTSPS
jgi:Rrf2 family nitric oxide-sensitive transcriptional repressor